MRIQHNIMAMNAYRNYNSNTKALSGNLEKLSSGYKINRAGDDAAGLAISEKMRAQITGLDAAQKNVKDGISLVKTAEGAMQEIQDMLNRMDYLATQSANGTYQNEVDRENLQKEVDALKTEINRIADSANFNGIKLLDGSQEASSMKYEITGGEDMTIFAGTTTGVGGAGTSTIVHTEANKSGATKFAVELENVSFTSTGGAVSVGISVGGVAVSTHLAKDATLGGADLAKALDGKSVSIGGVTYNVKADGSKLVFEMDENATKGATKAASFTGNFAVAVTYSGGPSQTGTVNTSTQVIEEGGPASGKLLANTGTASAIAAADIVDGKAITVGDTTYVFASKQETLDSLKAAGKNFKAVDISDIVDEDGALDNTKVPHGDAQSEALSRLTVAAADNKMFTVGQTADYKLTFQEKESYNGDGKNGRADLTTASGIQAQIQTGTFTATKVEAKGAGTGMVLQIGDTAEDFNQMSVSIKDMHVAAMGAGKDANGNNSTDTIADIDISTQEGAQKAVAVIKNAINYVSSVRGDLGAIQNRLDHTGNNLAIMAENIQDAESTIRDTDVADEMMKYVKNNILVQSAQAMLAQANQVPQGVLQLLG